MVDWALFFGRFHPLVVHLPIGALIVAALMAWLSQKPKFEGLKAAIPFVLGFGALSAILAVGAGWLLASGGGYDEDAVFWHRWLGVAVAVLSVGAWLAYRGTISLAPTLRLGLVGVLLAALGLTGHLGGNLTHGEDYLFRYAPAFVQRLAGLDLEPDANLSSDPDSIIVYTDLIQPILDETCVECHNPNKTQGGLLLIGPDQIDDGGDTGPVLMAGEPYDSELVRRITLPQSDDEFMPPDGGALPYHDVRLIQWWIAQGADYEASLADVEVDDEIEHLLRQNYGLDTRPKPFAETVTVPLADSLAVVALEAAGFSVQRLAQTSNLLDVQIRVGQTITPDALNLLADVNEQVTWLDLGGVNLTDADLAPLANLTNLSRLRLDRNAALTDAALVHLADLSNLESLNLYGTAVTDEAIAALGAMPNLQSVYLWQTNVTEAGAERLRTARPRMSVNTGISFDA
ncbi:MAG: ribonuclease inhibitor [Rhodothermales bacterium]